jgi:beta-lactamase regulating signal transducer with metallopeptidase domain
MTTTGLLVFALVTAAKASLVMSAAFLITRMMRSRPAAERHLVWMLASVCVLVLPLLTLSLPAWRFGLYSDWLSERLHARGEWKVTYEPARAPHPQGDGIEIVVAPRASASAGSVIVVPPAVSAPVIEVTPRPDPAPSSGPAPLAPARAPAPTRSSLWPIVAAIWLVGALLSASRLLRGVVRVRRLTRTARPLLDPVLLVRAHGIAAHMGIGRAVRYLEGDEYEMPLTFGIVRPTLLLPASAPRWSAARQDAVLRHELAHIRRRDSLAQLIAELGCALYWFNPLMWWAAREMCVEREHACDDVVLASGSRASDYAAELLDIARTLRAQRATALAAIAMARPTDLRARLTALLDPRPRRDRTAPGLLVPAWLGTFALVIPLSTLAPEISPRLPSRSLVETPAPAAPASPSKKAVRDPRATPLRGAPTAATMMPAPAPVVERGCRTDGKLANVSMNTNDDRHTTKWSGSGCSGELHVQGVLAFDPDFTRITGISRDGIVRITMDEDGTERRVVIRPSGSGLSYEYRLNGDRRDMDAAAHAWLDATLQFAFRRLGFMAQERAAAILARRGAAGVLAEVELLASDHTRAQYLSLLVERGRLAPAALRRVLDQAGAISSDHYRTQIITAVAGNYELTDAIRDSYIGAVSGMKSDHYRHTAFATLLEKGRLTPQQVSAVLRESHRIGSDHYRATLLEDLATRYRDAPGIRGAYLDAANGLKSDHYKAVVLARLLDTSGLTSAELAAVVDASAAMGSDHYRSDVLRRVADNGLRDAALQRSFVRAASGIRSDHYLQDLLASLAARRDLDQQALLALLQAAGGIKSDHYRSVLLIEIAQRHRLEGEARARFEKLMTGISSRHYRTNVLSALDGTR